MSGQYIPSYRVTSFTRDIAQRDVSKAQRALPTIVRPHQVTLQGKRYVAISAHQLLDQLSDADRARPGHETG